MKFGELISVAVTLSFECIYCLDVLAKAVKAAGATAEVVSATAAIQAGPLLTWSDGAAQVGRSAFARCTGGST